MAVPPLPQRMLFCTVALLLLLWIALPPEAAWLPLKVALISVGVQASLYSRRRNRRPPRCR